MIAMTGTTTTKKMTIKMMTNGMMTATMIGGAEGADGMTIDQFANR